MNRASAIIAIVKNGTIAGLGKHTKAKVIDILEMKSIYTNEIKGHVCLACGIGLSTNEFSVPFSTVVRNKQ